MPHVRTANDLDKKAQAAQEEEGTATTVTVTTTTKNGKVPKKI